MLNKIVLIATFCLCSFQANCEPNIGSLHGAIDSGLQIERQEVTISLEQIHNSFILANETQQEIVQTFVLPIAMHVSVDGQPIQLQHSTHAISNSGKDISKVLKSLGVPFDPTTALHTIDASPNRESIRNKLISLKLIDKGEETPNWRMKTEYFWRYQFAANSKSQITQSYKPSIIDRSLKIKHAGGLIQTPVNAVKKLYSITVDWTLQEKLSAKKLQSMLEQSNPQILKFCPQIEDYEAILNSESQVSSKSASVETKEVSYPYLVDDLVCAPVNKFTLKIQAPANMHALLCWDNEMKSSGKNTLIFEADNFAAQQNINILYVNKLAIQNSNPG